MPAIYRRRISRNLSKICKRMQREERDLLHLLESSLKQTRGARK
jgi:hypothetical protein